MHSFMIELDQTEIDALCAKFNYPPWVPDPTGKGPPQQRRAVPNPMTPEQFAQQAIEAFIERITDDHVGNAAIQNAHQQAIEAHRAQHPRRRERK